VSNITAFNTDPYSTWKSAFRECVKLSSKIIDRQDFEGKDILIVDDICVYGGTFKNLAKMLRKRNCGRLYLTVSHMTVQNLGEDPVTNYFDKVFTTNSKYDWYCQSDNKGNNWKKGFENLEIIKMF
jgi:phosphoribosylpyrophosphate synthetase